MWFALLLALLVYLLTSRVPMEVNSNTKNNTPKIIDPMVNVVISITPRGETGIVETSIDSVDFEVVVTD